MNKFVTLSLAAVIVAGFASLASAQQASPCKAVADAAPADAGFKTLGVRRPKIEQVAPGDVISVFVTMEPALARRDDGPDAKVVGVETCPGRVFFKAKVAEIGNFHATEVPVPETLAQGTKISSCSKAANKCWTGTFDGDFTRFVTLGEPSKNEGGKTALRGTYKD